MKPTLELARFMGEEPEAVLTWDEETGELAGTLADRVVQMARDAQLDGYVTTDPYPTSYPIESDPLPSRRGLALVLSTRWVVPELLRGSWPEAVDWAVAYRNDSVLYFVAETKGKGSSEDPGHTLLRPVEGLKIACGKRHFGNLEEVRFKVVAELDELVS